jgi:RNA recognition motif-containing protein
MGAEVTEAAQAHHEAQEETRRENTKERKVKTIFIAAVHPATTEEGFAAFIRDFGFDYVTPSDLSLPRNWRDGTAQGFALVRFKTDEDAVLAVRKLDYAFYKGLHLKVSLSKSELNNGVRLNPWPAKLPEEKFAEAPAPAPLIVLNANSEFRHGYVGHAEPKPLEYWIKLRQQWAWLDTASKVTVAPFRPNFEKFGAARLSGGRASGIDEKAA